MLKRENHGSYEMTVPNLKLKNKFFKNSNIKFTCEGKRHLEVALGTVEFEMTYVNEKIKEYYKKMENLPKLAKTQNSMPTSTGSNINLATFYKQKKV